MAMEFTPRMLEWSQTPKDSEAGNVKMFRDCTEKLKFGHITISGEIAECIPHSR